MGKWLALLDDEILQTPSRVTDKTHTTGVLQVLSVTDDGVFENSRPVEVAANAPDLAPAAAGLTCADCRHLLLRGTCAEPVGAGLLTAAEGFGVVWPPEGHGADCSAFASSTPAATQDRLYRPSREQASAAHAEAWGDAAIARFQARAGLVRRHAFTTQDAEDLAELLHLRDVQADHRVLCVECEHYRPGRCGNRRAAGLQESDVSRDLATRLQRCSGFARSSSRPRNRTAAT